MPIKTYKNIDSLQILTLDTNKSILSCTSRHAFLQDPALFSIFFRFFSLNDDIITYEEIGQIIRESKSQFHMQDSPDNIVANKYIFKARSLLKTLAIDDFIITVRGLGYKLSARWLPVYQEEQPKTDGNNFIDEITALIEDCIKHSDQMKIVQSNSGLTLIEADQHLMLNNFTRMTQSYQTFFDAYSAPGNSVALLEVREKMMKLLFYTIYWRIGDRLSESQFRADYKNELKVLLRQIKHYVNLLS